jgi:lipopolysaccharide biosynthesis protein
MDREPASMIFGRRRRGGDPVDLTLTWESGRRLPQAWRPERVAVIAHWSGSGAFSRSLSALAGELSGRGFEVLVVSAAEFDGDRPGVNPPSASVYRRPNSGYDFGTWSATLAALPQIRAAREVILANDSMAGPFQSLQPVLDRMLRIPSDIWSLTDSRQFGWHPQSYFVGYRNGVLDEPVLRGFWRSVRVHGSKDEIIRRYELGLGRLLLREAYSTAVAFPSESVVKNKSDNPTIKAWHALLDVGLPMVKRQLIMEPGVAADSAEIPTEVRRRFGTDIEEWI